MKQSFIEWVFKWLEQHRPLLFFLFNDNGEIIGAQLTEEIFTEEARRRYPEHSYWKGKP